MIAVVKAKANSHRLIYAEDEGTTEHITVGNIRSGTVSDLPHNSFSKYQARNLVSSEQDKNVAVHVVVSIGSGTRQAQTFHDTRIVPVLEALGLTKDKDYAVHLTSSAQTVTELSTSVFVPAALRGDAQLIILLSGDGGIVDIVNATMTSVAPGSSSSATTWVSPSIALLPLGTGNALAHSAKVTADSTMGLSTLLRGHPHALSIFRATFSSGSTLLAHETNEPLPLYKNNALWGCVVLSWGFHASLVADSDTPEYRAYGVSRFQMAGKENLYPADGKGPHEYRGRVSLLNENGEWKPLEREKHAYILATFVSNLEKTFTISPDSKPLDKTLRLVHFGPMNGDGIMGIMNAAYQGGKHVSMDEVGYSEVKGVRIEFEEEEEKWRRVCVDGKIVMVGRGGWVEVVKEKSRNGLDVLCLGE